MAVQPGMLQVTRRSRPRLVQWVRLEERLGHARVVSPEAAEAVVHQCKRRHLLPSPPAARYALRPADSDESTMGGRARVASHRTTRPLPPWLVPRRDPCLGSHGGVESGRNPAAVQQPIVRPPARHRPRCLRALQMSGPPGSHAAGSRGRASAPCAPLMALLSAPLPVGRRTR